MLVIEPSHMKLRQITMKYCQLLKTAQWIHTNITNCIETMMAYTGLKGK
jgi:hypothetical protein